MRYESRETILKNAVRVISIKLMNGIKISTPSPHSYYIDKFTVRLITTLGKHINAMNLMVKSLDQPTLVINGGRDYFTPKQYTERFFDSIPGSTDKIHCYYPEVYHLLMYDEVRKLIFADMFKWLEKRKQLT